MRQKKKRCMITFPDTTQAMAMEAFCRERGLPGRLIPVPGELKAGCGMCWMTDPDMQDAWETAMKQNHICYEQLTEMMF
ncbi:Protein of uncharacterised function (DUF3343) [uncultured Roseburia sp.]|uniref:DUF3343 domain-containing protein n=1 Tax=Brotonthovivens ammoniilytica TaxID=2981725 RepID=A0ABT2TH46_9FIRM|nr:DUF3343 domain-containing protein [Brotonthovivens ammoniilytica]MCU6761515.1 DUF3343 domain-containing protein [Brotonthovivens ammoniilytica]SCI30683.1 Protein of uncharacterised function (DUF3343) [uncultured Roseburia sp.]